jgi:hypothetical protein
MSKKVKTIYAVSVGSYSNYRVVALFTTVALAEEFMAAVPDGDYNNIEEFGLDPKTSDLIRRGYSIWRVLMLRDGTTEQVSCKDVDLDEVTDIGHRVWRRSGIQYLRINAPDCLVSTVWAKSAEGAVKIANEHRTQMIASGEWA